MPAGRIHDRITLWGLPFLGSLAWVMSRNSQTTLLLCSGYLVGGLILGPDLDIYSRHYQRWGWFRWIWVPYQKTIPHRSLWSHGFLVGTTLRLAYLVLWGAGLVGLGLLVWAGLVAGQDWWPTFQYQTQVYCDRGWAIIQRYPLESILIYVGLEMGAMSHSVVDWVTSAWKRSRRKSRTPRKKTPKH